MFSSPVHIALEQLMGVINNNLILHEANLCLYDISIMVYMSLEVIIRKQVLEKSFCFFFCCPLESKHLYLVLNKCHLF